MLSDEEKKAIEKIKKILYMFPESKELKLLLNLIENQQKEIEKLQLINQMQKYRIEVMDERELISRDEVKNIITSEIKEIEKFKAENDAKTTNYHLYRIFVDEVLQSILDKIKGDDK